MMIIVIKLRILRVESFVCMGEKERKKGIRVGMELEEWNGMTDLVS